MGYERGRQGRSRAGFCGNTRDRAMITRFWGMTAPIRDALRDFMRLSRTLVRSRRRVLVGYTKAHPIYTDVLEEALPDGFAGYRPSSVSLLRPLDRFLRERVRVVHCDAAGTPDEFAPELPLIIECEG